MKILIISHNCISNNNNMGKAMISIFSAFKKEELCQLYIYPSRPDIDYCNSYYRITDKEMLKSLILFQKGGKEIDKLNINNNNLLYENKNDRKIYNIKKKISRIYTRELIWKYGHYNKNILKNWINKEKPECIVFFPGNYSFFYDLAFSISDEFKIPIVTYFMDNFYNLTSNNYLEQTHQKLINKQIERIVKYSTINITLSDEMTLYYSEIFKKEIFTIMLGSQIYNNRIKNPKNIKNISYLGNMSFKRYEQLIDIGYTLDSINKEENKNYQLNIYGNVYDDSIIEQFKKINSIHYYGFVKGKEYDHAINDSDILLHIESFDTKVIERTKYSISSKISQIITSGRCVLAYGPSDIASISYLVRNKAAYVICDKNKLKLQLKEIIHNYNLRSNIIESGFKSAKKNQNCITNSKKIYSIIDKISR